MLSRRALGLIAPRVNYNNTGYLRLTLVSCEIARNGKSLISVFQEFSASFNKTFILAGRLDNFLSQLVYIMFINSNHVSFHLW